ncbi:MAG: (deoxy)nucleoside triphosphate pyrophosphohydrolase [Clostridiales bacterium]|nr:(deoxy)nucleoside triphosphate pyrophosphohydrolase [Clostridiales bacterium]
MTDVVAALIWREGRFLACRRPAHKARALLWEFPGGKVDPGETPEQALLRECREELAADLEIGEVYMRVVHAYPDLTVRLTLYHAAIPRGEPQMLEHAELRWVAPRETRGMDFCPADTDILKKLRADYP